MIRTALFVVIIAVQFGAFGRASEKSPQASAKKVDRKLITEGCLGCHGPYEKLADAKPYFKASSGEMVTPHQYVAHADKKDFPNCVECHETHETPLGDKSKVVKPQNLDWCYQNCHHANNFDGCTTCHGKQ
jgi:hypothetical protein